MFARRFTKRIIHYTWRPLVLRYLKRDRVFHFDGLTINVNQGVFHPGLFHSTKLLITSLQLFNLQGKSLLEMGCGSGMISCWSAREGADVLAVDISQKAVENCQINATQNGLSIDVKHSDLFENVGKNHFDFIVVNPPYYPRKAKNESELAWFCGEEFEYFKRFFSQLETYVSKDSVVLMSLSEDCDMKSISGIAATADFSWQTQLTKRTGLETHYVFQIGKLT